MINRVAAALFLVLLSPVLVIAAAAIAITLGRPVFFVQARSGLNGIPFDIVKFRTMREPKDATEGDVHRITRLGGFLRATSIDELPSLWNIAKGDMVFVGPRPFIAEYLSHYSKNQSARLAVKPGLTGWMQINGRNELTWEEKIDLDVWYVQHKSWRLDLRILLRTPAAVLSAKGISHPGDATMPRFKP